MDNRDQTRDQQVWQRVRAGGEELPHNDLLQLQREALELTAAYRGLAAQLTGKARELAQRLYRTESANSQVLAGIGFLSRQSGENLKFWQPGKEAPKKTLERCYHRTRRCMTEYMARSAEPEYGIVFQKLADRAGSSCALVAELLGILS